MKKLTYLLCGAAMLMAAACSNEEVVTDGNAVLTLSAKVTSAVATRANGDGSQITTLQYAIYSEEAVVVEGTSTFTDGVATITETLTQGVSYDVVCWADGGSDAYTFDAESATITVDYAAMAANDDTNDAFFGSISTGVLGGDYTANLVMTRPLTQLNVGIGGELDAAVELTVTVPSGLPTQLNLLTGETSEVTTEAIAFTAAPMATEDAFPGGDDYAWVAMNYLLVGTDNIVLTDAIAISAEYYVGVEVENVTLKRNYRTNIGLSSFNKATADVDINVSYTPDFTEEGTGAVVSTETTTALSAIALADTYAADNYLCVSNEGPLTIAYTLAGVQTTTTTYDNGTVVTDTESADVSAATVTWSSSDETIATVADGVVTLNTAGNFGEFTITATATLGEVSVSSAIAMNMPAGLIRETFSNGSTNWQHATESSTVCGTKYTTSGALNDGYYTCNTRLTAAKVWDGSKYQSATAYDSETGKYTYSDTEYEIGYYQYRCDFEYNVSSGTPLYFNLEAYPIIAFEIDLIGGNSDLQTTVAARALKINVNQLNGVSDSDVVATVVNISDTRAVAYRTLSSATFGTGTIQTTTKNPTLKYADITGTSTYDANFSYNVYSVGTFATVDALKAYYGIE